ncbi:MAG TPA: glycosyltransferase family 4 protein [Baekduia sp.]|nr:glycosyltransferase family 4 protein [Baekduia sp.]
MILFLHNRYRVAGGEERVVDDLLWLVREHLGEDAELLTRDSATLGPARAAAGLVAGGLEPTAVAAAVRRTGARVVHAHNLLPAFGWRALAAARGAGARVVLHLHNYRLVCAVGTCVDPSGADCTRCHGRNTAPGVRLNCRGTGPEAVVYGAALALWQRRLVEQADAVVVPSAAARDRLAALGAPAAARDATILGHVVRAGHEPPAASARGGGYALVTSRLAREKGIGVAIDACRAAGLRLVVCGEGPLEAELRARAAGADVTFAGRVDGAELARLRAGAAVALVPSLAAETFGLAALEAMAAGVPVVASRAGALAELEGDVELVAPGDAAALAAAARRVAADPDAGARARAAALRRAAPEVVAPRLAAVYAAATA